MINQILLLLLIIHCVLFFIFKPNVNILSCGLFGWFGKTPNRFNKDKFDKLGIYNDDRGGNSCGVTVDKEIIIGIDDNKLYKDFISNSDYNSPKKIPTVFGHTRKSSFGKNTIENAHPFGFGGDSKGFKFAGIHNGTLLNHEELAKEHNINLEYVEDKKTHKKIDSEVLLEILYKEQDIKVLSEYNGAASLIWSFMDEPNVVYCFRGESPYYKTSSKNVKERPLFYYSENKNSLYVSSTEESLKTIAKKKGKIKEFKANTVYKITNGDISKAKKFIVKRNNCYQKNNNYGNYGNYSNYSSGRYNENLRNSNKKKGTKNIIDPNDIDRDNIYNETNIIDPNEYKGKIYFNKLRFWRNGHLINGIYVWIPKYGYKYLCDEKDNIKTNFKSFINTPLVDGDFLFRKKDIKDKYIPFKKVNNVEPKPSLFYFYKGVKLKEYLDYSMCLEMEAEGPEFDYESLSYCSTHPIMDIDVNKKDDLNQKILLEGQLFTGKISPLGSDKIYNIRKGNCTKIKKVNTNKIDLEKLNQGKTVYNLDNFEAEEAEKDLEEEINGYLPESTEEKIDKTVENDLVQNEIEKIFTKNYRDFPRFIKRLEKFKNNKKALFAIDILEDFVDETTSLIAIEPND